MLYLSDSGQCDYVGVKIINNQNGFKTIWIQFENICFYTGIITKPKCGVIS